jgi:hypothetical protein
MTPLVGKRTTAAEGNVLGRLILAAAATMAATWAYAAELTPARRDAIRQLGEAEAIISLCPRYEYSKGRLIEFYADARLPPSLVTSDEEFEQLYEEAQEETRMLMLDLSEMMPSDVETLTCAFAKQIYRYAGDKDPILTLTDEALAADELEAAKAEGRIAQGQEEELRALAEPVARALMLSRLCRDLRIVVNQTVFQDYAGSIHNPVRTEAKRMADENQVEGIPPVDEVCSTAEAEFGPSGTLVKDLLNITK